MHSNDDMLCKGSQVQTLQPKTCMLKRPAGKSGRWVILTFIACNEQALLAFPFNNQKLSQESELLAVSHLHLAQEAC